MTRRRTVGVPLTKAQFATLARIARKRSKSSVLLSGLVLLEQTVAPSLPPSAPRKGERAKHASAYLDLEACARLRRLCLLFRWNESDVLRAALEAIAQQNENEDDHDSRKAKEATKDRMDRKNLEPRSGVRESLAGVQELLCNATSRAV